MDNKLLNDAAECAMIFVEKYSGEGAKTKRYKALKALAELTLDDLKNGKPAKECTYNAYVINEKITGNYSKEEGVKRNVNRYLKDLGAKLPSHEDILKVRAQENNLTAIPNYDFSASTGGGSGIFSTHCLQPIALNESELSAVPEQLPGGAIRYYLETIDNLPGWIKWINNFELSEWRIKIIAAFMFTALLMALGLYAIFMMVFLSPQSSGLQIIKTFISSSVIGLFILWPFRILYLCVINRIINAPILFQPNNVNNAQIECVATKKIRKSTGKPIRKLRIVSYAATCPLCDTRIEVEPGGKEFHNRLIGRCLESPMEHIFSFDRVQRLGWPLRKY